MLKRPKEVTFEFPQPPGDVYPASHRSGALIGPSGVGKTSTALSMLRGPYRNVYSRVYVFSPSCAVGVDSAWDAWRKHVRIHMRVPEDEQTMWPTWEPAILEKLIARHQKVNAHLKAKKQKKGYTMLVLVDDFADDGDNVMHSRTSVRGRHSGCACWLLTQKQKVLSTIIRTYLCWLFVWRLINSKELMGILEELDALHNRKTLMAMYQRATINQHDFWFINLLSNKEHLFSTISISAWL